MADTALTQREFDTWRESDDAFKQQMLVHIQTQTDLNLVVERRISTVEAKQEDCEQSVGRKTTWISSIVSAIVGGVVGALTGRT